MPSSLLKAERKSSSLFEIVNSLSSFLERKLKGYEIVPVTIEKIKTPTISIVKIIPRIYKNFFIKSPSHIYKPIITQKIKK